MKYLILLLVSFSVYGSYALKTDLRNCETQPVPSHTRMSDCGEDCVEITNKFKCETYLEQDTQIDDFTKPKYTKNDTEVCSNQNDCETKLLVKICTDTKEAKYISEAYDEVYCSKPNGYEQKTVKIFREDVTKKAAYDTAQANEETFEDAIKLALKAQSYGRRVMALMLVRNVVKGLTTGQKKQLIKDFSDIKSLLEVGSLEAAKDEINLVVPDGVLVTDADKIALIQELDKYLIP